MQRYQFYNQQYIAGAWATGSSSSFITDSNPYNQEVLLQLNGASEQDVNFAYQSAADAFKTWSQTTAELRTSYTKRIIEMIQQRREEIIDWLIWESGSTRLKANIEVDAALAIAHEAANFPSRLNPIQLDSVNIDRQSIAYKQALGVIAVISPWNFPFHLSLRSVITAIAIGNTVVLKPASDTPISGGLIIAKIIEEAGLPAGVFNVVVGSGGEIGDYFVNHAIPKMISFTGSTSVGQRVGQLAVSGPYLKRIALELGGNAPLVILDDADIDLAVELTVMGRFLHQGQICMSTNRVIVDAKIYDQYLERLLKRARNISYGDPELRETLVGPIINQEQTQRLKHVIEQAIQEGAELVFSGDIQGQVIPPHIFTGVEPQSQLAQQESFGPILPILKARDEAHALTLANDTVYGLASAVCTRDIERGKRFALQIEAGMTHINAISVADDPVAPFGGEKNSGLGRFNGQWILDEFSRTHWVTANA